MRRHAASLVNMWDSWFAFLLASGKVSVILRSSDKTIVLAQLKVAKAAFEAATPPPPSAPLGGGLGLTPPAVHRQLPLLLRQQSSL